MTAAWGAEATWHDRGVTLVLILIALAGIAAVAAVATGRIGGGLDEPTTSRPDQGLPDSPLEPRDVDRLRFSLGLRGYRMQEVDHALERLREELVRRDAELADCGHELRELRQRLAPAERVVDPQEY